MFRPNLATYTLALLLTASAPLVGNARASEAPAVPKAAATAAATPEAPARESTESLAQKAQNPIANMISLPFQNNIYFGVGPGENVANVLNIQPVIPFQVGDWNIITRTIVPVIYLSDVTEGLPDVPQNESSGGTFGLGDINFSAFLSPADSGEFIWGIGPSIGMNTATSDFLGTGKWTAGPSAIGVWTPGRWVLGGLIRNLWSFGGQSNRPSVNTFLLQPFVNFNFSDGWYATTSPVITSNWQAGAGNRWTLPLGGGVGKIARIGNQPINLQAQVFGNAVRPDDAPAWNIRLQVQLLFPK